MPFRVADTHRGQHRPVVLLREHSTELEEERFYVDLVGGLLDLPAGPVVRLAGGPESHLTGHVDRHAEPVDSVLAQAGDRRVQGRGQVQVLNLAEHLARHLRRDRYLSGRRARVADPGLGRIEQDLYERAGVRLLARSDREFDLVRDEEQTVTGESGVQARADVLRALLDLVQDRERGAHGRVGMRLRVRVRRPDAYQPVAGRIELSPHPGQRILKRPLPAAFLDGGRRQRVPEVRPAVALGTDQAERLPGHLPVQRDRGLNLGALLGPTEDDHSGGLRPRILGGPCDLPRLRVRLARPEHGTAHRVGQPVGSEAQLPTGVVVVPGFLLPPLVP